MEQIFFELRLNDESNKRQNSKHRKHGRKVSRELKERRKAQILKFLRIFGEIVENVLMLAGIAFAIWFFASWLDIIAHNSMPNPQYHDWNFFQLFM